MEGHPVQIVRIEIDPETKKSKFHLNEDELHQIVSNKRIKNMPVAVVSIAGAFRRGKSFMLNFFIRYLATISESAATTSTTSPTSSTTGDWLGPADQPLQGFSWRAGSKRDTVGILMWSEPFVVQLPPPSPPSPPVEHTKTRGRTTSASATATENDATQEVAVLLVDTQGSFDSVSTMQESATVFSLSTMLSSVQIYNIASTLQEDNLQHLEYFLKYGELALEEENSVARPFQNLHFLIRDWQNPFEYAFGQHGGNDFLAEQLRTDDRRAEHREIRDSLKKLFDRMACFLMPHPGNRVATNQQFTGCTAEIDAEFVERLREFVPLIFAPSSLVVKTINGERITPPIWAEYFRAYVRIFDAEDLPEPKTMFREAAEANHNAIMLVCKTQYQDELDQLCSPESGYVDPARLSEVHAVARQSALTKFDTTKKLGARDFAETYRQRLVDEIDAAFDKARTNNESKNVFKTVIRNPLVLIGVSAAAFFLDAIVSMVGLPGHALLAVTAYLSLCALVVWIFLTFSDAGGAAGQQHPVVHLINETVEFLLEHIIQPGYTMLLNRTANINAASVSAASSPHCNSPPPSLNSLLSNPIVQTAMARASINNQ